MENGIELSIKASTGIEGYIVHRCERNLVYGALKPLARKSLGLNKPDVTGGVVAAQAGEEWEKEVLEDLIPEEYRFCKKTDKEYGKFDTDETKDLIIRLTELTFSDHNSRYIYQGQLEETERFRQEYFHFDKSFYDGTDDSLQVHLGSTYPDFIRVSWNDFLKKAVISIVDCKLASVMRLQHKAQITLYSHLLRCMVDEWHESGLLSNAVADTEEGYLWNRGQQSENAFPLSSASVLLDLFFDEKLPETVVKLSELIKNGKTGFSSGESLADQLDVCVSQTCEWCENFIQCRDMLARKGSVSLIPYLSGYAQEHAKNIGAPDTLKGIMAYIRNRDNESRLRGNRNWEMLLRDGTLLEVHEKAYPYTKDKIFGDKDDLKYKWKRNARSFTLPKGQMVSVFLTVQKDVGTGKVCILGWHCSELILNDNAGGTVLNNGAVIPEDSETGQKQKWRREETQGIFISENSTDEAYLKNSGVFIRSLCEVLESIQGKSAQVYVADSYERKNLEDLLYDLIDRDDADDDTRSLAMKILLWIQGDRIVTGSDVQPAEEIDDSVIVLIPEIRRLLSLPLPISYNLRGIRNVLGAYVPKEMIFYEDDTPFFDALSDAVRSEAINDYWNGKNEITEESIRKHITKRFVYAQSILGKVQSEGRKTGVFVSNAGVFALPEALDLDPVICAKWMFEIRNEELLAYHGIRNARMQDLETALLDGSVIKAQIVNIYEKEEKGWKNTYYRFKIYSMGEFRAQRWFSILMTREDDPGSMYRFPDYHYSSMNPYLSADQQVAVLNGPDWSYENGVYYLDIQYCKKSKIAGKIGETYLLSERYTDINSYKSIEAVKKLKPLSQRGLELLDVSGLCRFTGEKYDNDKDTLSRYSRMGNTDFTRSQKEAFIHLYENTLTVLQGPPGTGKTDFIARAVITLCRFYKEKKDRDLRVLVSANSHAAIENVLFSISGKLSGSDDIKLIKADRFDDGNVTNKKGVVVLSSEIIGEGFENSKGLNKPAVVGATNWSVYKMAYKPEKRGPLFDIIIIDEASQVRVMDAMLGLSTASDDARFLFVGDDDQLPPIIQGNYRKEPGVPYDYGSVFRYYNDHACGLGCSLMLGEDFRMNEILLRYSAEKIYGSSYKAFDHKIGTRHLDYKGTALDHPEWIRYALDDFSDDPDKYWPLVFFRISGGTADEQADLECRLVTGITCALRNSIGADTSDEDFWNESSEKVPGKKSGLFGIISPHHKHIEKLKNAIHESSGMDRDDLFIGTVDKLQGQERDAVIVSYGVTDIEQATVEGEFIFNRNRLNVSLTRGKCKTLVLFSEVLTKCPVELYASDDEDIQKGADFVCGLYDFMKRSEADTDISSKSFEFELNNDKLTVEICRKRCITKHECI